jgi:UDP-N-acetylmuramoyl-L-alanyl-D-glutamate--2,6-diaminopimelate ligase
VVELASARVVSGSAAAVSVRGVSLDSRSIAPGDLYAALPGAHAHGAQFASAATAAGAVAVLTDEAGALQLAAAASSSAVEVPVLVVSDPRAVLGDVAALVYAHAASALRMIGITGTNGKTTTAYLVESALRALGARTGLIGTVETRIGDERLASVRTTPEAPDLHAILAVMHERGTDSVVMEVSSHALAQHRVDGVRYDVALFTNLSQDHLDFHADMADYFEAKAGLFTPARARQGVVCVDDDWGVTLAQRGGIPLVTVSSRREADWTLTTGDDPQVDLLGPGGQRLSVPCHLPGTFNRVNTAMAAVALLSLGYAVADVERAMALEPVVPGRMERVSVGGADHPRCVVDYAHTPDAVDVALGALRPSTPGLLVAVLGAGGDRDRSKRRAMGAAAAKWADVIYVTDDNPRSEDPASIRDEVLAGAREGCPGTPTWLPTRNDAPARSSGSHQPRDGPLTSPQPWRKPGRSPAPPSPSSARVMRPARTSAGWCTPSTTAPRCAAALRGEPYRPEDDR